MSFFGKIKQGLGIGTARLELEVPGQVAKAGGEVKGKVVLTGKSDQKVKSIKVRLVEEYTTGRGDDKKTREYELGALTLAEAFDLKKDERREVEFTLPFKLELSSNQSLAEQKGALGMLGKAAVFAGGEKSEFFVKATADLDKVALDPDDSKPVRLV
jgi:sporulation-control protein spo0M